MANGKQTNIYLSDEVRRKLDALRKSWGNLSRGKAIERLLEIAKERPGRTLRVSGGVKLPLQRKTSDVALWAKGGAK